MCGTNQRETDVTPYQERMKQSKDRKSRILRLRKKVVGGKAMTYQAIADEIQCTKAYVQQVIKAAEKSA